MQYYLGQPAAVATMTGGMLRGTVKFYYQPDCVLVVADVSGLPQPAGNAGAKIACGVIKLMPRI